MPPLPARPVPPGRPGMLRVTLPACVRFAWDTLCTYRHFSLFASAYLALQAALFSLLIGRIPYTEIDFSTYLAQAQVYSAGERQYTRIGGPSGPCVYPAAHLYLHAGINRLLTCPALQKSPLVQRWATDLPQNTNPLARFGQGPVQQVLAQGTFALLGLATSAIVLDLYRTAAESVARRTRQSCVGEGATSLRAGWRRYVPWVSSLGLAPAAPLPPFVLLWPLCSKRLLSIYVLRMFNDPWAMGTFYFALWALVRVRIPMTACIFFSLAVAIKMNVLLFLPAWGTILQQQYGIVAVLYAGLMLFVQGILAWPFAKFFPKQYFLSAFDFGRQFEYRWTVNWRMLPEHLFLSPHWAKVLLILHASIVAAFVLTRWTTICHIGLWKWVQNDLFRSPASSHPLPTEFVLTSLVTSNLIGIALSRSLHYQFFCWYAQLLPFCLVAARLPLWAKCVVPFAITVGWETVPSTTASSSMLLVAHALLLLGLWRSSWGQWLSMPTSPSERKPERSPNLAQVDRYPVQ